MTDLRDFLAARLDEDEQAAHAANAEGALAELCGDPISTHYSHAVAEHVIRHHPSRVLREVQAKRAIIEAEQWRVIEEGGLPERMRPDVETDVMRLLAAPFSDHPEFRKEWAV